MSPTPDDLPMEVRTWDRAETEGWRARMPAGFEVGTRGAVVRDFDGPWIGELTLRGQIGWRYFSAGVEFTGTAGVSEIWQDAAPGNLNLDLHFLVGRKVTHAIGLKGVLPTGTAWWWGTMPSATVVALGGAISYVGATDRWVWQIHTGVITGPAHQAMFLGQPDVGAAIATIQPIGAGVSLIGEIEGQFDLLVPVMVRALARWEPSNRVRLDVGLAVDNTILYDPSVQVIFGASHRW